MWRRIKHCLHFSSANCSLALFLFQYSLAYACLKLVNYSFFFWLPFYLSNNFGWKEAEADQLSIWYDVGGIIGEWARKWHPPTVALLAFGSERQQMQPEQSCSVGSSCSLNMWKFYICMWLLGLFFFLKHWVCDPLKSLHIIKGHYHTLEHYPQLAFFFTG